ERAVGRISALADIHIGMTVPELRKSFALRLVAQVLVYGRNADVPHRAAVLIIKENCALQKIFVVAVNRPADVTVGVGPLTSLNVNPGADQSDRRSAFVCFDQGAFRLVIKNLTLSQA